MGDSIVELDALRHLDSADPQSNSADLEADLGELPLPEPSCRIQDPTKPFGRCGPQQLPLAPPRCGMGIRGTRDCALKQIATPCPL